MKFISRKPIPVSLPLAISLASATFLSTAQFAASETNMYMPVTPALSPDGSKLVFSWENDLWLVSTDVSDKQFAEKITTHPGREYNPIFSSNGKTIFYNSNKEGVDQVFSMPLDKSTPSKQVTFHSESNLLEDLSADGDQVIYRSLRDKAGRLPYRIFQSPTSADKPEKMLFDADAKYARVSPDGNKVLFTREGTSPYRVGYKGSQAGQIWIYDKTTKEFTQPVKSEYDCLNPIWLPDGSGFYYLSGKGGSHNIFKHELESGQETQLTSYEDVNVMFPVISRDGSTIIYRHLLHYYVLNTKTAKSEKLTLQHNLEKHSDPVRNTVIKKTEDFDFSESGLEITFTANGNIFAMDTILREPVQLTDTSGHESNLYFGDKGKAIYYIFDDGITSTIKKLTKKDAKKFWWENSELKSTTVVKTSDSLIESFSPSPDGKLIGFSTSIGELIIYDLEKKTSTLIAKSWNSPSFNWSPNSEWVTYSLSDDNFNSDVFIAPVDGSEDPVNVTKHPDNEYSPSFSPDGKKLSFMGKRHTTSYDLYYVDLTPRGTEKSSRDKKLEMAKKAMQKDSSYKTSTKSKPKDQKSGKKEEPTKEPKKELTEKSKKSDKKEVQKDEKKIVKKDEKKEVNRNAFNIFLLKVELEKFIGNLTLKLF